MAHRRYRIAKGKLSEFIIHELSIKDKMSDEEIAKILIQEAATYLHIDDLEENK